MDLVRSSLDKNIDYLVSDNLLDIDTLKDKQVIIVGERHGNDNDEYMVKRLIRACKPDFVLVEALGDYALFAKSSKRRYEKMDEVEHHYGGLTKRWLKISLQFDIPFIGIEYVNWKEGEYDKLTLKETFKIREQHWLKLIKAYAKKGKIIVVCGDTHLRTIKTPELGEVSPLYLAYNGKPDSVVIRSEKGEIY